MQEKEHQPEVMSIDPALYAAQQIKGLPSEERVPGNWYEILYL